jgi:hypothetical protein
MTDVTRSNMLAIVFSTLLGLFINWHLQSGLFPFFPSGVDDPLSN